VPPCSLRDLPSPGWTRLGACAPERLGCAMESGLKISHQALQAFAAAPRRREMIRDHACVAEIQQHGCLLGGEADQVLVVVVDDLHQICKQHPDFVGRNPCLWMGKPVIP